MAKRHEELDRSTCLELLAAGKVGRLGVDIGGYPLVLPMHYVLDGERVVMRTNVGSKFSKAPLSRVTFEVDDIDFDAEEGWSVIVHGIAEDISDTIDTLSEHARSLELNPWTPAPTDRWLMIIPSAITGRRIVTT